MQLAGASALVTGASAGIGRATARALHAAGARLVLTARSAAALEELAVELGGSATALALPADLTRPAAAGELVAAAGQAFGGIDLLVNNAGLGHYGPLVEADWPDIARVVDLNFLAPLRLIRAAVPAMTAGSVIINVASVNGRRALPNMAAYSAAKFALVGAGQALRLELAPRGIALCTLLPGATRTDFNHALLGDLPVGGRRAGPLPVAPERVARRIVALARRPRPVAYVTVRDRLWVALAMLAPGLVDAILARRR